MDSEFEKILAQREWWHKVGKILDATLYGWTDYTFANFTSKNGKYEICGEVAVKLIELAEKAAQQKD